MNRPIHSLLAPLLLALAGTLGSCVDGGPTGPLSQGQVQLRQGQSVRVANPPVLVTFRRVVAESRCPMNARCFVAGEVVVEMSVSSGRRSETFQLRLTGEQGDSDSAAPPVTLMGHDFQLYRLDPYPEIQSQLLTVRPLATLIVR